MTNTPGTQKTRKRNIRRLAGVNRRIAKLCNELESLQQLQGALARDVENDAGGGADMAAGVVRRKPRSRRRQRRI